MSEFIPVHFNSTPVAIRDGISAHRVKLLFRFNIVREGIKPALIFSTGSGNTHWKENGIIAYPTGSSATSYWQYSHLYDGSTETWSSPSYGSVFRTTDTYLMRNCTLGESTNYYDSYGGVLCNQVTTERAIEIADLFYGTGGDRYSITYRPTNCSFSSAPTEAAVGDTVIVPVVFTEGYQLGNPSDIYVTCNGNPVESTYSNGTLTFIMPDPS